MERVNSIADLEEIKAMVRPLLLVREDPDYTRIREAPQIDILICRGTGCTAAGSGEVEEAFKDAVKRNGLEARVRVIKTGCRGFCEKGPNVTIFPGDILYTEVSAEDVSEIVEGHLFGGEFVQRLLYKEPVTGKATPASHEIDFYKKQRREVMHLNGLIDPWSIEEYIAHDGYRGLAKALLEMKPEEVLEEVRKSGIRGRGGAGFPTGTKWGFVHSAPGEEKFVLCNGDEGDPGAFMNRSVLEGNPHSVIEGMTIGAYAIGNVRQGYAYIRAEYPLAIETMSNAIRQAREYGFLGEDILGTGFDFEIDIFPGAGAFVCGEETALMRSIEGERGNPRQRPPFPANKGLFDKPSTLNNVETWSNIPRIILKGGDWYSSIGAKGNTGTKTFCLVGKINNSGIAEVPLGTLMKDLIFDIGGGCPGGKKFKAVQIGGPSGGVIPYKHIDTPVDYESITGLGAIMGSGGLIVMDEDNCMVDVAKFYLGFTQDESCGKCTPCRAGIPKLREILTRISEGRGRMEDIDLLAELGGMIAEVSLCGLGQTAPNPVLSTLRHFREEYEAHIIDKRCPTGVCKPLVAYHALEDKCMACLINIAGFEAGGYEAINQALLDFIPGRVIQKVKPSGGCVVDLARFLMTCAQREGCGECVPCRVGTTQMLGMLEDIAAGNGTLGMLDLLIELGDTIKIASRCTFGTSAADPVLSLIKHFRDDFEEHIIDKHCPSGMCKLPLSYHMVCPIRPSVVATFRGEAELAKALV